MQLIHKINQLKKELNEKDNNILKIEKDLKKKNITVNSLEVEIKSLNLEKEKLIDNIKEGADNLKKSQNRIFYKNINSC